RKWPPRRAVCHEAQQAEKVYGLRFWEMSRSQIPRGASLGRAHSGSAEPGRPNAHLMVMLSERTRYPARVAPYSMALGPRGVLQDGGKDERPSAETDRCTVTYRTTQSDDTVQDTKRWADDEDGLPMTTRLVYLSSTSI